MIKRIIPVMLSAILLMTGCANTKSETKDTKELTKLTYSNLIDEKTQNEIRDILIENKIDKKQADYFIKLVKNYNGKSDINKLKTSKQGFTSIKTQQVPYDEVYLDEKWDPNKLNYMDFNCRLTAFSIFKNYIKSEDKFTGDSTRLVFDKDAINNNPISKFSKEDIIPMVLSAAKGKMINDIETKLVYKN
ncbi:DUF4300 family protein [[Eubacterium] tenue]|nr:DUF4300 family protein [[Eubacterium] tenue]MBC8630124.1 DUF4300 family protein [[Eubacterium] tenue]